MEKVLTNTLTREKIKIKRLASLLLECLAFYVLAGSQVKGFGTYYFSFGVYFALLWCHFNPYLLSMTYFLGCSLRTLTLTSVYIHATTILFGIIIAVLFLRENKTMNRYILIFLSGLSQVMVVYQAAFNVTSALISVAGILLGMVVAYLAICCFSATIVRGYTKKLNLDEKICLFFLTLLFCMGLPLDFYGLNVLLAIATLSLLILSYLPKTTMLLITGLVFGLGAYFASMIEGYLVGIMILTLIVLAFKNTNKYITAIATIMGHCFVFFALESYPLSIPSMVSLVIVTIVFVSIPKKSMEQILQHFFVADSGMAVRNVVNRSKDTLCKRISDISLVFKEMDRAYRHMVQGLITEEEAKTMLSSEVRSSLCKNCANRAKCHKNTLLVDGINDLITTGFEKGKVSLLDVPQYLSSNCSRLNAMLSAINSLLASYKHYASMITNMDSSRLLIADTLGGMSEILQKLSGEVQANISYDGQKEERIMADLSYENILATEAIVYEQDIYVKNVTIVVKNFEQTLDNTKKIEKIVSKVCGVKMKLDSTEQGAIPSTKILHMITSPNYDLVYGTATVTKSGVVSSGDTHSLIEIETGKYLVALCDGMGSGEKAHSGSRLAIGLLENFYKAGFDNEIILTSINKLLSLSGDENFNALDVAVLDFQKNNMDFIKLGAPKGYLKRSEGTEVIGTNGLPLGVLEEMKPHITNKKVENFDMLVLVTDGISDAFGSSDCLKDFINNMDTINPQTMADSILDKAVSLEDGHPQDDMSVSVVRIFKIV